MAATIPAQAVDQRQDVRCLDVKRAPGEAALTAMEHRRRSRCQAVKPTYARGITHRAIAGGSGEPPSTVKSRTGLGAGDAARSPPVALGGPVA